MTLFGGSRHLGQGRRICPLKMSCPLRLCIHPRYNRHTHLPPIQRVYGLHLHLVGGGRGTPTESSPIAGMNAQGFTPDTEGISPRWSSRVSFVRIFERYVTKFAPQFREASFLSYSTVGMVGTCTSSDEVATGGRGAASVMRIFPPASQPVLDRESERKCVCLRERESARECVCERERERESLRRTPFAACQGE